MFLSSFSIFSFKLNFTISKGTEFSGIKLDVHVSVYFVRAIYFYFCVCEFKKFKKCINDQDMQIVETESIYTQHHSINTVWVT